MNKISLNHVREEFLKHMSQNGHVIINSSPLIPENDPTTLFTGSGMQPMLPYLLGQPHPNGKRVADSQKCFRSQDIEEVGDNRHTTFFEMLGNWSLGDYFKEEQIEMMWDFLINKIKLDPGNLYISCFEGSLEFNVPKDSVSSGKWQELFKSVGIDAKIGDKPEINGVREGERIFYYSIKKNTWSRGGNLATTPMNDPSGPDTEMFYDFDPENNLKIHENSFYKDSVCHVNCDCGRYVEIGNNVFMQYKKTSEGIVELEQKNVDFGGGLERIVEAVNNDPDIFNLDVFDEAKLVLEDMSKIKYVSDLSVDMNNTKNTTFAYRVILDHIRAATFLIGDGVYPGSKDQQYFVRRLIRRAVRFARNLNINTNFTSAVATTYINYYKYTYENLIYKEEEILKALNDEESKFRKTLESGIKEFEKSIIFLESKNLETSEVIIAKNYVLGGDKIFDLLQSHGFPIELTEEMLKERNIKGDFEDAKKRIQAHSEMSRTASAGKFKGGLGGDGESEIKYHTATHMLHQALKMVLGESVAQRGSNITSERLRFDFAFERKMTDDEIKKVEDIVNSAIKKDYKMIREEVSYDEARSRGAIGLFDDKYGDKVSVYHMGESSLGKSRGEEGLFSLEFCGGPHVESTGSMGTFRITKEEAVQAGVRRIKAVLE